MTLTLLRPWRAMLIASALSAALFSATALAADSPLDTPLNDLHGNPQKLSQWRGKPMVINFWASWCGPCREETPDLIKLHKAYDGKVQFVGVAVDDPIPVTQFIRQYKIAYPILLGDNALELMTRLGNTQDALPFTVVIDSQGKVVLRKLGQVRLDETGKTLNSLLGSKK